MPPNIISIANTPTRTPVDLRPSRFMSVSLRGDDPDQTSLRHVHRVSRTAVAHALAELHAYRASSKFVVQQRFPMRRVIHQPGDGARRCPTGTPTLVDVFARIAAPGSGFGG